MKKKEFLHALGPFFVSALLLSVIQGPGGIAPLAWIAYVPIVLAASPQRKVRTLFLAGYPVCAAYWLANLYWMVPVTWPGWLAFCLYSGLLWPVLAVCVRYCRIRRWPLVLAAPVFIVGVERLQGLFLGGFFWRFLAHSQYANTSLIQIADIFGAAGVSFLVASANGLTAELVLAARQKRLGERNLKVKAACVVLAVVLAVFYGRWRIAQTDRVATDGPMVACVQSNVPQSVKQTFQSSSEILADILLQSRQCGDFGADLIVWPETMVQATINDEVLEAIDPNHPFHKYDEILRQHAKNYGNLLVGTYTAGLRRTADGRIYLDDRGNVEFAEKYNSAILYDKDGVKQPQVYSKIHLVPFGEVLPFKQSAPWLYRILMWFTPYDYDYSLDYGTDYTVFQIDPRDPNEPEYRFAALICYEDTVPGIGRRFAKCDSGGKDVDWLVNISNDGWFVTVDERTGQINAGTELAQHAAICVFRAIETRLAVVRSVNTGISCLIDSAGRIRSGFEGGNLPDPAMNRVAVAGWFADRVPIDKRVTFFCRYGQWLDISCMASVIAVLVLPTLLRRVRTKKGLWFLRSDR